MYLPDPHQASVQGSGLVLPEVDGPSRSELSNLGLSDAFLQNLFDASVIPVTSNAFRGESAYDEGDSLLLQDNPIHYKNNTITCNTNGASVLGVYRSNINDDFGIFDRSAWGTVSSTLTEPVSALAFESPFAFGGQTMIMDPPPVAYPSFPGLGASQILYCPEMVPVVPLPCKWNDCRYIEMSSQNHKLLGHLMNAHTNAVGPLQCEWAGCASTATFGRKHELKRHLKVQHVDPRAFPCRIDGCSKIFKREDNLREHMKRQH